MTAEPRLVPPPPAGRLFGAASRLGRRTPQQRPFGRHSRVVALLKVLMPASALTLLLLVAAWPRIQGAIEHLHFKLPRLDVSQARDLRMVNARYSGLDRHERPFTLTAESARQRPGTDDLVELETPKGDMTTLSGTWIALSAFTGVYQPQSQLLDLFGEVNLYQDKGNEFRTDTAHVDMGRGTAEGHDAVEGHGPFGTVTATGFRIEQHGDVIVFTGKSRLVLEPRASKDKP